MRPVLPFPHAFVLLRLVFLLLPTLVAAEPSTPGAAYFAYGHFCSLDPVAEERSADTISGTVQLVEGLPEFAAEGPNVPAQIGVGFGVHVQTLPQYAGPVLIVTEHPPMGPEGVTRQSWVTSFSADAPTYVGYSFEYEYELLPGLWTLSAQANGREIYSVTFNVFRPAQSQGLSCRAFIPLS